METFAPPPPPCVSNETDCPPRRPWVLCERNRAAKHGGLGSSVRETELPNIYLCMDKPGMAPTIAFMQEHDLFTIKVSAQHRHADAILMGTLKWSELHKPTKDLTKSQKRNFRRRRMQRPPKPQQNLVINNSSHAHKATEPKKATPDVTKLPTITQRHSNWSPASLRSHPQQQECHQLQGGHQNGKRPVLGVGTPP